MPRKTSDRNNLDRTMKVLDGLSINSPCSADWERIVGTDQVRFCQECRKYVYDLSSVPAKLAEAIVWQSKGNLCARFARLADGTTITTETITKTRLLGRRPSPVAAALMTAVLSTSVAAINLPNFDPAQPAAISSVSRNRRAQIGDGTSSVSGVVVGPDGAIVAGAKLTLTHLGTQAVFAGTSSESGEFRFTLLDAGSYQLRALADGFALASPIEINLGAADSQQMHVNLLPLVEQVTVGAASISQLPLRLLYEHSDLVVWARAGDAIEVRPSSGDRVTKRPYIVSSILKGNTKEEVIWLFGADSRSDSESSSGQTVLLFLGRLAPNERKERGEHFKAHGIDSVSAEQLPVYQDRMSELAVILKKGSDNAADIVEWLVRCAEEPATRHEGTYELEQSARVLESSPAEPTPGKTDGQKPGDSTDILANVGNDISDGSGDSKIDSIESRFAAMLTTGQKQRLIRTLYSTSDITQDDPYLIELVERWEKPRLIQFLVSQLEACVSEPPPAARFIVGRLADMIDDDDISDIASDYQAIQDPEPADGDTSLENTSSDDAGAEDEEPVAAKRSKVLRTFIHAVRAKTRAATLIGR